MADHAGKMPTPHNGVDWHQLFDDEQADCQEAIADLAHAVGIDPEKWDHDSCPNNADIIREITAHILARPVERPRPLMWSWDEGDEGWRIAKDGKLETCIAQAEQENEGHHDGFWLVPGVYCDPAMEFSSESLFDDMESSNLNAPMDEWWSTRCGLKAGDFIELDDRVRPVIRQWCEEHGMNDDYAYTLSSHDSKVKAIFVPFEGGLEAAKSLLPEGW